MEERRLAHRLPLLVLLVMLVISSIGTLFGMFFTFEAIFPSNPAFFVKDVSVSLYNNNVSNTDYPASQSMRAEWNVVFKIQNMNRWIDVDFNDFIKVSIKSVMGSSVGLVPIFRLNTGSNSPWSNVTVEGTLPRFVNDNNYNQSNSNAFELPFFLNFLAPFKFVDPLCSRQHLTKYSCGKMSIGFLNAYQARGDLMEEHGFQC